MRLVSWLTVALGATLVLCSGLYAQEDPYNPVPHHGWMNSYVNKSGVNDSLPYVIVTSDELAPVFEDFAHWKWQKGTPAEVITTSEIASSYQGDSLQIKIRDYLRTRNANNHTRWLLIGGDFEQVPTMYFFTGGSALYRVDSAPTDYYYACLDYEWNEDGDEYFGEGFFDGDTVDSYAELYIGRIPAKDTFQARVFINKLIDYETNPTDFQHYTEALLTSTDIDWAGDDEFNQTLSGVLQGHVSQTVRHQTLAANLQADLLGGPGLIINCSHAQNAHNFLTFYGGYVPPGSSPINFDFFDTTSTDGSYSVWLNSTCHYGSIENNPTLARSYLFNPTGWGVGYFGSMEVDQTSSNPYYKLILEFLYDSTETQIGKAISLARDAYQPFPLWPRTHFVRFAALAFHYFGDPQMNFFTEQPQELEISAPYWLSWDNGQQDVDIEVSTGNPVEGVLVCLSHDDGLYELAYTDEYGTAHFDGIAPPEPDSEDSFVTICVSKANYFTALDDTTLRFTNCDVPGDADNNCMVNISDVIYLQEYIFNGGPLPPILNRGDACGDCLINITDMVYIVQYIFNNGPDPVPGCMSFPPGGKLASGGRHPDDRESYPADLKITKRVSVDALSEGRDIQLLRLTSDRNIHALSITLNSYSGQKLEVSRAPELPDSMRLTWSQSHDLVKISLLDLNGREYFGSGISDLLYISGTFEIDYVLGVEVTESGECNTLLLSCTSLDTLVRGITFDQNFPNPFNPVTNISFSLPSQADVTIEVFNVLGQRVRLLANRTYSAGKYTVTWDGTDDQGQALPSGVYFSRFLAGDYEAKRKMVIVK